MIKIENNSMCSGCAACFSACPRKCIQMQEDIEGFLYPVIQEGCVDCGICNNVCPFLRNEKRDIVHKAWAAYASDSVVRNNSSSGGVFSLIAKKIIEEGGIVYGAAFSEDWKTVNHIGSTNYELFQSSKYVQSRIGYSFIDVRNSLKAKQKVVFSGTPCQVAGLKSFLGKEYPNLICIDVICHGVPSPLLWAKYVEHLQLKHGKSIEKINFRNKRKGWINFCFYTKQNGRDYFCSHHNDPYMQIFLTNRSLRPSCYNCKIKEVGSSADITLGDLWGVENIAPEFRDDKGISAVIIHTEKGEELFLELDNCIKQSIDYNSVVSYNSPIYKSVNKPSDREDFFRDLSKLEFKQVINKYGKPKLTAKQKIARTKVYKMVRPFIHKVFKF